LKRPFYSGLSGKIAIIFLAGFIFIILPINIIVYNKLDRQITANDDQQMTSEANKIINQVKLDPIVIPLAPYGHTIHVQIHNGQNFETLFASPEFPLLTDDLYFLQLVTLDSIRVLTTRKFIDGSTELFVSVAHSNKPLEEQLNDFKIYLFYLTGIAIGVIAIIVFTLSGFMLKPLKGIISKAEQINASESMARLPVPITKDETQELSVTLNNMLSRIEKSLIEQLQFFDSATHELKTPLTIMKAQLSLTLTNTADHDTRRILQETLDEVGRLERTIDDFLLLSQLKTKKLELRLTSTDLSEIVFDTLSKLKDFANLKTILFNVTQTNAYFPIHVDKDKIQTVVLNILENAVHYTKTGTVINVDIAKDEVFVMLTVINTTDIPKQNREQLGMKRYAHSNSARGMGLGLWICNQLIELHNGEIQILHEGQDFSVTIKLPTVAQ
jgi:signal transduction histidine kinase